MNHTDQSFICPGCGERLGISREVWGSKARCPVCECKFVVAEPSVILEPPKPVPPPAASLPAAEGSTPPVPPLTPKRSGGKAPLAMGIAVVMALGLFAGAGWFAHQRGWLKMSSGGAANSKLAPSLAISVTTENLAALPAQLRSRLTLACGGEAATRESMEKALATPAVQVDLARHEVIHRVGLRFLQELSKRTNGTAFLNAYLNDPEWMQETFTSGPVVNPQRTLHYLYLIWKYEGASLANPIYCRMATAMAIEAGRSEKKGQEPNNYAVLTSFRVYREHHEKGLLHVTFDKLPVWTMRFATMITTEANLRYLIKERDCQTRDYYGACWSVPYIGHNIFGDSIQGGGAGYYTVFETEYPAREELIKCTGGVCGSLSTFGCMSAKAHGIASQTVGEPGHCAYVVRNDDGSWGIAYHIGDPPGGYTFWGGSYPSYNEMSDAFANSGKVMLASEFTWLAHVYQDEFAAKCPLPAEYSFSAYSGRFNNFPNYATLKPVTNGTCAEITVDNLSPSHDNYSLVFEGAFTNTAAGALTASLRSDDGSRVLLDGRELARVNCSQKSAGDPVEPGAHTLRVEYFQLGGAANVEAKLDFTPPVPSPAVAAAYLAALETCPLQFGLCSEIGDWAERANAKDVEFWRYYAQVISTAYSGYHELGWLLIARHAGPALKAVLTPDQMVDFLMTCHRQFDQPPPRPGRGVAPRWYEIRSALAQQWNLVDRNEAAGLRLFKELLALHGNDTTPYLAQTLEWGNNLFGRNPKTLDDYLVALRAGLYSCGRKADMGQVRTQLINLLRSTAAQDDVAAYQRTHDLIDSLFKPDLKAETGLNTKQLAARPKLRVPAETLLSANALVKTSSQGRNDRPLTYRNLLGDNEIGGLVATAAEDSPWVTVVLPGLCDISDVVVLNCWERKDITNSLPLVVSVSQNGRKWTNVATAAHAAAEWRFQLAASAPDKAKYVRLERKPGVGKLPLQFRQIQIYGKRLY